MSAITVVQLMAAARERELGALGKPGKCTWIELPFACLLCVGVALYVFALLFAKVITGRFRDPDTQMPYDTRDPD